MSYVTIRCTKTERLEWHRIAKREGLALAELLRREIERVGRKRSSPIAREAAL
jgi:hypothetical protein